MIPPFTDWNKARVFRRLGRSVADALVIINFPDGVVCLDVEEATILANAFAVMPVLPVQAMAEQMRTAVEEIREHHAG